MPRMLRRPKRNGWADKSRECFALQKLSLAEGGRSKEASLQQVAI